MVCGWLAHAGVYQHRYVSFPEWSAIFLPIYGRLSLSATNPPPQPHAPILGWFFFHVPLSVPRTASVSVSQSASLVHPAPRNSPPPSPWPRSTIRSHDVSPGFVLAAGNTGRKLAVGDAQGGGGDWSSPTCGPSDFTDPRF